MQFLVPSVVAADGSGNIYVADTDNSRIRVVAPGTRGRRSYRAPETPRLNGDGKYEDVNGNGRKDFGDVVVLFSQMNWIAAHEPVSAFDYNANGRVDFADVVWLFNHL